MSATFAPLPLTTQRIARRTIINAVNDRQYRVHYRLAVSSTATHCYLCGYPLAVDRTCVNDECSVSIMEPST